MRLPARSRVAMPFQISLQSCFRISSSLERILNAQVIANRSTPGRDCGGRNSRRLFGRCNLVSRPNRILRWPRRNEGRRTAFISDANNHAVYIVRQGQVAATLDVDGPAGLAADASHNLYVANVAGSNTLVYAPPYNGTPTTLTDPGFRPNGVAVDAKGNVAVTSYESNSYGFGSIAFYAKGATSPTKVILADSKFAGDYYCAFDASGNLYLDSKNGSGPFEAGEVVGGIAGKVVKPLTTANLLQYPGGVQVTKSGQIAILDQSNGSGSPTIYTYSPPSHGSLGKPVATTPLSSANDAVAFAFEGRDSPSCLRRTLFLRCPGRSASRATTRTK